jgi:ligand-binding sensor domain-containing protein/signal transduction histidine kinase
MRISHGFLALLQLANAAQSEQLPIRFYTPLDGLPGIAIHRIVGDSKGFLWFCTNEGLSRFDGHGFVNYGAAQGLADPNVSDLLETREGDYWVGTPAGLYRLTREKGQRGSESRARFVALLPQTSESAKWIDAENQDPSGAIWVGTKAGLFRFLREPAPRRAGSRTEWRFELVDLGAAHKRPPGQQGRVTAILSDRRANLWIGSSNGIYLLRQGRVEHISTQDGLPNGQVLSLAEDAQSKIWVGTEGGLCRLRSDFERSHRMVDQVYTAADGLPSNSVKALLQPTGGFLWIGTSKGLAQVVDAPREIRSYATARGLGNLNINALAQDRNGNVWIGTDNAGAVKLEPDGFISYGSEDGLGSLDVTGFLEDREGALCAVTRAPGQLFVNRFQGTRFCATRLPLPADYYNPGWVGWYQVLVQSRSQEWWAASFLGLVQFPAVRSDQLSRASPIGLYDRRRGLGANHVHQIFEDSRGRLWISTRDREGNAIIVRDPVSGSFYRFSETDGLPSLAQMHANGFFEDRAGQIWIGLHRAGVLRFSGGHFRVYYESDGVPEGGIRRFYQDRQGRLWLGSGHGGLGRIDDPQADRPKFVTYGAAQGLSGSEIQAITEDQWGRIYAATGHGVDRLEPSTGSVRWYTTADGLAPGEIQTALRDRRGVLWFGTVTGVSSLSPVQDPSPSPPPVRVMGVRISGISYAVNNNGEIELALPDLPSNRNHVQLDFVGISYTPGDVLRYQYKLEPAEVAWGQPAAEGSVIYANLAPGKYRFLVRALNAEGHASSSPAMVRFTILSPLWAQAWFLGLLAAVAAAILYAAHHYRIQQLLRVERLRTRLASDLHDEIGSGLSLIGVLSEVAKEQLLRAPAESTDSLQRVAEISRELLDSMSDIVWALNTHLDRLGDLTNRMRRFANEIFRGAGLELDFRVVGLLEDQKIDLERRRQIYLIFREGVRNILRHSFCRRAAVHLSCKDGHFVMVISDDGRGFDPAGQVVGQGLTSMRERALSLGGRIEWTSEKGTVVTLRVPLPE